MGVGFPILYIPVARRNFYPLPLYFLGKIRVNLILNTLRFYPICTISHLYFNR